MTRLLVVATLSVLCVDAALFVAAFFPDAAALIPGPPSGSRKGWLLVGAWLVGFSRLVWAVSRDRHYVTGKEPDSPYVRAIPPHRDGVDLLAGRPGAGAWEMAKVLRAGSHGADEERQQAHKAAENWEAGARYQQTWINGWERSQRLTCSGRST